MPPTLERSLLRTVDWFSGSHVVPCSYGTVVAATRHLKRIPSHAVFNERWNQKTSRKRLRNVIEEAEGITLLIRDCRNDCGSAIES